MAHENKGVKQMRYVSMKKAEPGMQLAYNLFDSFGRVLLSKNASLTESYIEKLIDMGFPGVYINDELSEGIELDTIITPELRSDGLACVRRCDVDGCKVIAKNVVEQIAEKGVLMLDLSDLRTFDDYTYAHSVNVAVLSCVIGFGIGLGEQDLTNLVLAGLLHDVGKLSIPSEILNKPGRLTADEYQIMKSHALLSYEMIKERLDISAQVKQAVLYHHENVDGSGYPNGVRACDMNLFAKILHVADVYDALVSKRPYKKPYSAYEATEYLMGGCGIMFDRKVVTAFLNHVPLYPKGTLVRISDGREAIIYDNTGAHNLRPVLRLITGDFVDMQAPENLRLTVAAIYDDAVEVTEAYEREREMMLNPEKRYKVLVVDDKQGSREQIKNALEDEYDIELIRSGAQAVKYIQKKQKPDVILMEIDMIEQGGIETAKKINKLTYQNVPILFISSAADAETVLRCKEVSAAGYILKPFNVVYLKSEIKRAITGRSDFD